METKDEYMPGEGKKVGILGVPAGFGAETAGSELGAAALRLVKFRGSRLKNHIEVLGYEVKDYGDVEIRTPDYEAGEDESPKYFREIFENSQRIVENVKKILGNGDFPVLLGGDHSIAAGTFSGVSSFFREREEEIGLIWFDAHADMNTPETTLSGNMHGMPLAFILGEGDSEMVELGGFSPKIRKEHCAHIGGRDLDLGEKRLIQRLGMRGNCFTMSEIDKRGMLECVEEAIKIASKAGGGFAVTFDVDVMDPRFAPGSGTLVRGGINYREAHLALEMIAECGKMRSFEIVEVNPVLDKGNITVELAVELILSALGNKTL